MTHESQKRPSDLLELVTDGCELPHKCWELNLVSLQEQASNQSSAHGESLIPAQKMAQLKQCPDSYTAEAMN